MASDLPTSRNPDPDHQAVAALLASDDWQRRLDAARLQRAKVLEHRVRAGQVKPSSTRRIEDAPCQGLAATEDRIPSQQRLLLSPAERVETPVPPVSARLPGWRVFLGLGLTGLLVVTGLWAR